tara:strand:- start:135 stop:875 length:741 start_codon:yes stop_codon:yes gene_type:complete
MKLFLISLLFINVYSYSYSNTIFYLTKIPNLKVHDLNSLNGIKYLKAEKSFKVGIVENNVQCDVASEKDIKNKFITIKKNFDRYEKGFLEKVNLRYVVLCQNLRVSNIKTAGVPNHNVKTLIVDIKSDERYFERSLHHELFHMVDDSYDSLFSDEKWSQLNNPNFKYAKCSTCSNRLDLTLYKDTKGFLTEYSMSTASEDMAEIFSFLMIDKTKVSKILLKDPVINNKINFLKDELTKIDDNFKFE